MAKPLQLKVVSEIGGALVADESSSVSFVMRDQVGDATWPYLSLPFTHSHHQNGFYRASPGSPTGEPGPGEWLLVVTQSKRSVVVQRLTLAEENGVLRASAGWGVTTGAQLAHTALTLSIVNYEQAKGDSPAAPAQQSLVTVRLLERLEVVALGCLDITGGGKGGTHFEAFAKGRTNLLYADGALNDGVVFTLFIAETRRKEIWVKSRSPKAGAWVLVGEEVKAPIKKGTKQPVTGQDLGILDFYEHLHNTGRASPGTVIEAGIFGHSFVMGPLVWNTGDAAASYVARDPDDFDGRQKDWVPGGVVASSYPNVGIALHPDRGSFRVWGCNHMMNMIMELNAGLRALDDGRPRGEMFLANLNSGRENMSLDHLKANVAQLVVSTKVAHTIEEGDASGVVTYCGAAVQALGKPCFGAPPGMGSNFGMRDGELIMHIAGGPQTENERPMKYYEREFGSFFVRDANSYIDFNKMRAAPLPDPGWSTARFIVLFDDRYQRQILRMPSGMTMLRKPHERYLDATPMTLDGIAGHLYVAPSARLDHLQLRGGDRFLILQDDKDHDVGVFVGTDGSSVLLGSPTGKGTFVKDAAEIWEYLMNFRGGEAWDFSLNPPTKVTGSVLESVVPRWYW